MNKPKNKVNFIDSIFIYIRFSFPTTKTYCNPFYFQSTIYQFHAILLKLCCPNVWLMRCVNRRASMKLTKLHIKLQMLIINDTSSTRVVSECYWCVLIFINTNLIMSDAEIIICSNTKPSYHEHIVGYFFHKQKPDHNWFMCN